MHNLQRSTIPFPCLDAGELNPPVPLHHAVDILDLSNRSLSTHEIPNIEGFVVTLQNL